MAPDGGRLTPVPTDETKQVNIASIYALTKYVQERSCQIFGAAYGVDVVALRMFNVFGPGQALSNPYTGVLANFGARLLHGEPPLVFEDGQQMRDFVHVRDVARAFRLAMESPSAAGHAINIGSGRTYTIARVAELLAEAMGVPEIAPLPAQQGPCRRHPPLLRRYRQGARLAGLPAASTCWRIRSTSWCNGSERSGARGSRRRCETAARSARSGRHDRSTTDPALRESSVSPSGFVSANMSGCIAPSSTECTRPAPPMCAPTCPGPSTTQPGGQAWYDWLMPTLGREFDLLPCVHYTPPSLSRTGRTSGAPHRLKDYADFVDHVLSRYGDHFRHVELWNEPNNLLDWDWRLTRIGCCSARWWAAPRTGSSIAAGRRSSAVPRRLIRIGSR